MPFLNEQILIINKLLRQTSLADARFTPGRFEGIAQDVSRKSESGSLQVFPGVMNKDYEAQDITINDTWPLIIYHKVNAKSYQFEKSEFGDSNTRVIESSICKMVVYGKYGALKLTKEQLEGVITANFPDNVAKVNYSILPIDGMFVTLRNSNLNSNNVFNEEYKNTPLFLAPEDIFFSINYTIDTRFRKGCIKICDCVGDSTNVHLLANDQFQALVDDNGVALIVN